MRSVRILFLTKTIGASIPVFADNPFVYACSEAKNQLNPSRICAVNGYNARSIFWKRSRRNWQSFNEKD